MRVSGLASGMDIDKMVSDLMKVERVPLDKLYQKKQTLEWQRDDYRAMNTLLKDLDDSIFNGIYKQSNFSKKTIVSSNESAVSVRNINSTSDINTSINVYQLAETAYINSSEDIRSDISFDPTKTLSTERTKLKTDFVSTSFSVQSVNADGTLGEEISFTFDPNTESLNDVLNKINNSNAGVSAFYDSATGRISTVAKNTGDVSGDAEIKLTGDIFNSFKLAGDNITAGVNGYEGKNASFSINGLVTERSSNTFQVNGYEYTLKQVTDDNDGIVETGEKVTITSKTDTDAIYKTIEDFVNKYNEIIYKINSEISEEKFRSYKPLTNEEKAALSDREVDLWEAKAKSGMLRGDSILTNSLSTMRMDLSNKVDGLGLNASQLSDIGITTSSNYLDKGKLVIDETKLRDAIENDPDAIYQLFNKETVDANGKLVKDESGVAIRLRDSIKNTISTIEDKAGNTYKTSSQYSIGKSLDYIDDDILRWNSRLIEIENRYWQQFTAMEKAIQKGNEQSAYLAQQFGM